MNHIKTLPPVIVSRYRGWRATTYEENKTWYHQLAEVGQSPRTMVITCCDSRMQISSLFNLDMGEVFVHQNIANLVPTYKPDGAQHGTSAAIEYAVKVLKVASIIVLGHSNCGGIKGAHKMFSSQSESDGQDDFLTPWLKQIKPGFERALEIHKGKLDDLSTMEQQSVLVSMENIMSFPYVKSAVDEGRLALHALWNDTGAGLMLNYNPQTKSFETV